MIGEPEELDLDRWVADFEEIRPRYKKLKRIVVDDLTTTLRERGLDSQIHGVVTARVKKVDSFRTKIGNKPYTNPLNQTCDLLGVRVVCLYPSVVREIDTAIRETFDVIQFEDKGKVDTPDVWRYSSVHYDCELPGSPSMPQDGDLHGLVFEIQVRTILQDAWATVEHKLGYKPEKPIPDELKREFSALAGLFHVADKRFQFIADQIRNLERAQDIARQLAPLYRSVMEEATESADARTEAKIRKLENKSDAIINRGSLKALLHGVYPGRPHLRNLDYTKLTQDLASAGIATLGALGELLLKGDGAAREREGEQAPLSDVAFARLALSASSPKFQSTRRPRRTG